MRESVEVARSLNAWARRATRTCATCVSCGTDGHKHSQQGAEHDRDKATAARAAPRFRRAPLAIRPLDAHRANPRETARVARAVVRVARPLARRLGIRVRTCTRIHKHTTSSSNQDAAAASDHKCLQALSMFASACWLSRCGAVFLRVPFVRARSSTCSSSTCNATNKRSLAKSSCKDTCCRCRCSASRTSGDAGGAGDAQTTRCGAVAATVRRRTLSAHITGHLGIGVAALSARPISARTSAHSFRGE